MKLVQGQKYNLILTMYGDEKPTEFYGIYFMGFGDCNGYEKIQCDCCGKSVVKHPLIFRMPVGKASYDECRVTYYTDEIWIGSSCLQKADITISPYDQESYAVYPESSGR